MNRMVQCSRCRQHALPTGEWIADAQGGVVVSLLCPECQTPEEDVEAEINSATTHYAITRDGRVLGTSKPED